MAGVLWRHKGQRGTEAHRLGGAVVAAHSLSVLEADHLRSSHCPIWFLPRTVPGLQIGPSSCVPKRPVVCQQRLSDSHGPGGSSLACKISVLVGAGFTL